MVFYMLSLECLRNFSSPLHFLHARGFTPISLVGITVFLLFKLTDKR